MSVLDLLVITLLATEPAAQLARADSAYFAGQDEAARRAYREVLARDPRSVRANHRLGLLLSRVGRLDSALVLIARARELEPRDPGLLLDEARLLGWAGRLNASIADYHTLLSLDPDDSDARQGLERAQHAQRPRVELDYSVSEDSDHNVNGSRTVTTSFAIADGVRGLLSGGSLAASDPARDASRTFGEAGLEAARGRAQLTLAGGTRWLDPAGAASRSLSTYRASMNVRASRQLSVGAGFAHSPLDETAALIGSGLEVDELNASIDAEPGARLSLSAGGGAAWLSDGNRRTSVLIAVMHPLARLGSFGVLGRVLAYERSGVGYFSPDRFALAEARTVLAHSRGAWTGRLNASVGSQQVGAEAATQLAWRVTGDVQCAWAPLHRIVASVGASNSAASSTTGAYRYLTAALGLRLGL
ncbi:MAG: hypothetical protein HOP12_02145 [Candidatus Eisenbacteria bacterium]|uniref:Tetratricopeptide repeat protein n=1 Tax=Eiseniibacteriota bacterium TaxID=2212470 RepID=A0A849SC51_UNCEI|nr:hypothetical protein [Candidatus Eisenbacteria bacterium]